MADTIHTDVSMRQDIVCPLCLKIMIASEGRRGAIQSYRCQPKPNMGGWETRPQKDKWAHDFFEVLNAKKDQVVTLSDGITKMNGLDQPSDTRFLFSHEDGVKARQIAMKYVVAGKLRAPRNWDKTWGNDAGATLDELKRRFPELYQTQSRNNNDEEPEQEIGSLGEGFFEGDEPEIEGEEGTSHVSAEPLTEEDEELIAEEEESYQEEGQEQEQPAYSVVSELGLDEEFETTTTSADSNHHTGPIREITIDRPSNSQMATLHTGAKWFKDDLGDGEFVYYYKVRDPNTGEYVWLEEGVNECYANIKLNVRD